MDRAKVMDKIQKCMNLSKSSNEHEAAAALRQAQKLMAAFDITERELGAMGYTSETVNTTIQAGAKIPIVLNAITCLVMHAFGVKAVYGRTVRVSCANFDVTYFGPEHRVALATHVHVVVQRAVDAAWKRYQNDNPGIVGVVGGRAGFVAGWISTVRETVERFALTPEEKAGTELAQLNEYGRSLSNSKPNKMRVCGSAMDGGAEAGASFRLHTPMTGKENLKLNA